MGTYTQDVTVVGWVGSDLRAYHLDGVGGVPYAQFRLASTRRVLDRQTGTFRDGPTLWFTVKAWRTTAVNLEASLVKGDPVVVVGRLGQSEWVTQDGAPRTELVLEALAVGHDLSYGSAKFRRTLTGPRRDREDVDDADEAVLAPRVTDSVLTDDPWSTPASDDAPAAVPARVDGRTPPEDGTSGDDGDPADPARGERAVLARG